MYKTSVITANQLQKIKEKCVNQEEIAERQTRLREISRTRAGKWGNTIDAQRKKKELMKQRKKEEQERILASLDEEEKNLRAEARTKVLERAQRIQFEQNERVKSMTAVLHQVHIIDEWEKQKSIKAEMSCLMEAQDRKYLKQEINQMEAYDKKETEKMAKRAEERKLIAQMQQDQLKAKQKLKAIQKIEKDEDAQHILAHIRQVELEAEEKLLRKQELVSQSQLEMVESLNEQLRIKEEQQEQDKRIENDIQKYAEEKERKKLERKMQEIQAKKAKQAIRDAMIEKQAAHLSQLREAECGLLESAKEEKQKKFEEKENMKKEKQQKRLKECEEYMHLQLENRRQEKQSILDEDIYRGMLAAKDTEAHQRQEKEKLINARKAAIEVRKFQKEQILAQKRARYNEEVEIQQYINNKLKENVDLSNEVIKYAEECSNDLQQGLLGRKLILHHVDALKNSRPL